MNVQNSSPPELLLLTVVHRHHAVRRQGGSVWGAAGNWSEVGETGYGRQGNGCMRRIGRETVMQREDLRRE